MTIKVQRENLGEGWGEYGMLGYLTLETLESLLLDRHGCGLDVYFGPTASFEEVRRGQAGSESLAGEINGGIQ